MTIGPTEQPLTLSVEDAAVVLGCGKRWLTQQARSGKVPHTVFGDGPRPRIRFTRDHIDQIITAREQQAADPLAQPARSHTARRKP